MDLLSIHLKIFDQDYTIKSPPHEETFVREAGKLIQERVSFYRARGIQKDRDVIAIVALECVVASLKSDEQGQRLTDMADDRILQMDKVISSSIA